MTIDILLSPPFILLSSTGTFSVMVTIFVCLIREVRVPSGFCKTSSTGFSKVSIIFFGSIVWPGIKIIVFSPCFLTTETLDSLFSSLFKFLFCLSFKVWFGIFCLLLGKEAFKFPILWIALLELLFEFL